MELEELEQQFTLFKQTIRFNDFFPQGTYTKGDNDDDNGIIREGIVTCRADLSHRTPSHQPDQLIEQHKNKKQCGARYKVPSFIHIHILLSVYQLRHTCTIKLVI